jgi:hypothetical protein
LLNVFLSKEGHFLESFSSLIESSSVSFFPYVPPKVDDKTIE